MKLPSLKSLLIWLALLAAETTASDAVSVVNTSPSLVSVIQVSKLPETGANALARTLSQYSDLYRELFGITDIRAQCVGYVPSMSSQLSGLKRLSDVEGFTAAMNSYVTSFKVGFPKFDSTNLTIYLLPSFGRYQAQARTFHDKPVLLLDSDFFSTAMRGIVAAPFVHHELFHIYHGQICPDMRRGTEDFFRTGQMPSLGTLLWVEGLAVHGARQLNPDASDAELFPSAAIVAATEKDYARLVKEAADSADNATMPSISGFFYIPRLDGRSIPQNCGYVIGERLIDRMLKEQPLEQVMFLRDTELTSAVRRAATQIAGSLDSPKKAPEPIK